MKWNDAEREQILLELEQVLADAKFNTSQRCIALLRHLVEAALKGEQDRIKERTLGIDVFGRDPDYDVNADPIVRRTAAELRKRLAQHYQDTDKAHGVRIRLSLGSYMPQFTFGGQPSAGEGEGHELSGPVRSAESDWLMGEVLRRRPGQVRMRRAALWGVVVVLALAGAGVWIARADFWRSTGYLIWKPLLGSNQGLFVCIPDDGMVQAQKSTHPQIEHSDSRLHPGSEGGQGGGQTSNALYHVAFVDALNANRINTRLAWFRTGIALRSSSQIRLHQFRRRSIVLVGGFNNPWSMTELADLRYSLREDDATGKRWIEDRQNPASRNWEITGNPEQTPVDYAVITRFWDANTGGWMMVISGLGQFGTEAAVILMTDPAMENLLPRELRTARNFQIVLKTSVIDGSDGSPRIETVHTW